MTSEIIVSLVAHELPMAAGRPCCGRPAGWVRRVQYDTSFESVEPVGLGVIIWLNSSACSLRK